ncbi:hypothetical protein TNCV_3954961 [Trichonephila clavipes]|nr:hypothetical protein TNCV_3954961 [Trichonephila clavipes]
MFDSSKPDDDVVNTVSELRHHMQSLHPKPPKHHGKRPAFIHPGLLEANAYHEPIFSWHFEDRNCLKPKNEAALATVAEPQCWQLQRLLLLAESGRLWQRATSHLRSPGRRKFIIPTIEYR